MAPSDESVGDGGAAVATAEAAKDLREELCSACSGAEKPVLIGILGSTEFRHSESERLVQRIADELVEALGGRGVFVTGGMKGVQESFAKACKSGVHLFNLLPEGESSSFAVGKDMRAGKTMEERRTIFGQLCDIYVTVEGGPGVAEEARVAFERGAALVPLARTGGASAGMFNFPAAALECPASLASASEALKSRWALLAKDADSTVEEAAAAVGEIVRRLAGQREKSIWEILDELVGVSRGTLIAILAVVLAVLCFISCSFIYSEYSNGRTDLALLHGGFLFLLLGLVGSVAFVIFEATRLEDEQQRVSGAAGVEQKKND